MGNRVRIVFVRDNYDIDYDVVEDFASIFCIAKKKHQDAFQKFHDIIVGEEGLLVEDSMRNQVLFLERSISGDIPIDMIYILAIRQIHD